MTWLNGLSAPVRALMGGALIGLSASLLLLSHGRVAGVSGIFGGLLQKKSESPVYRLSFLAGLFAAGALFARLSPGTSHPSASWITTAIAGVLVGYGTQLGNGCTSGHGVCGLSRLSARSFVATVTFIAAGAVTVFVARLLRGAH